MNIESRIFGFFLTIVFANSASAGEPETLVLNPTPKKIECKSTLADLGEGPSKTELCVTQGNFSSDLYSLKINGKLTLHGIDDQTTSGIDSTYKGRSLLMQCTPQNVQKDSTAGDIKKIIPLYPEEKIGGLVDLMRDSAMPVEIGRLCLVSIDKTPVMNVQVIFN